MYNAPMKLEEVLQFIDLTNKARGVRRAAFTKGVKEAENDLDHSAQLALIGWCLIEQYKLPLNTEKVLQYALAHDLVEVYAGDVYIFDQDNEKHEQKAKRERAALRRLEQEFPGVPSLWEGARAYLGKSDREAVFVYALDKMLPILNHVQEKTVWQKLGVTFKQMLEKKTQKVLLAPELHGIYQQLVEYLTQHEQELFAPENKP